MTSKGGRGCGYFNPNFLRLADGLLQEPLDLNPGGQHLFPGLHGYGPSRDCHA